MQVKQLAAERDAALAQLKGLRCVLEKWKNQTPQIDNGTCAICRIGTRFYDLKGNPEPCPREECFSREVDAAIQQ